MKAFFFVLLIIAPLLGVVFAEAPEWMTEDEKQRLAAMNEDMEERRDGVIRKENISKEERKKEQTTQRKREINAEAWRLVKKEFPHLFSKGSPSAETVRWMLEWDEYYKVHDPELAENPARPIHYARMNDKQQQEAAAAAREAAAERHESSGQRAIDELKAEIASIRIDQANAARAQQAALDAQAQEDQRIMRRNNINRQQDLYHLQWNLESQIRDAQRDIEWEDNVRQKREWAEGR